MPPLFGGRLESNTTSVVMFLTDLTKGSNKPIQHLINSYFAEMWTDVRLYREVISYLYKNKDK